MLIHVETQPIFFLDMPDMTMLKKTDIRTKTSRSVIPLPVVFWKWGERKQGNLNKVQKCKQNLHLTSMIAENQVDYHFIWYEDHSLYNLNMLKYKAVGLVLTSVGRF